MKKKSMKILSLLLTLVLLVGVLPGMTAYAADQYTVTVTYGGTTILTDSCYELGDILDIYGTVFSSSFWGFDVIWSYTDIVANPMLSPSGSTLSFSLNGAGNGTISCGYSTAYGSESFVLHVTCVKNVVPVSSVSLDYTNVQVKCEGKVTLTASVLPADATDRQVKWSVNGSAVTLYSDADCTTPVGTDATETLTVYAKGTAAGSATVTATSNADSTKSASCNVTVVPAGFTVTYDPGKGSGQKIEDGPHEAGDYIIQAYDQRFTAPEGKVFDYWQGSDGGKYRDGQTIQLTADLTLTAQWKDKSQGDGSKGGGSGSGYDIVFSIPGADNSWEYVGGGYAPQRAYRLSFAPMQGGSAYFVLTTGETGETMNVYPQTTVRVVPTPEPGYRLASIVWSMIDGSASYDITEAQTFVMPAMDAVVYVTFQPAA